VRAIGLPGKTVDDVLRPRHRNLKNGSVATAAAFARRPIKIAAAWNESVERIDPIGTRAATREAVEDALDSVVRNLKNGAL
jgi:hypothetical protein